MAQPTARAMTNVTTPNRERIVDFEYQRIKAPFLLRCAALCIDYILLLMLPLIWLVLSGMLSVTGEMSVGVPVWTIGVLLFLANFLALPLVRGQTIGKMIMGLTILSIDGTKLGFVDLLRRNLLGYVVTVLTLGLGFLVSAVNMSGRALHDFIGGTVVVRAKKNAILN